MKIKITRSTKDSYWYKDKIGEEFKVIKVIEYHFENFKGFQVVHKDNEYYVDLEDAEVLY
jgi:hypothetical protein